MDSNGRKETTGAAQCQPRVLSLPEHIARLVNPTVLAERAARLEARVRDQAAERVRQRRYAEIMTKVLLETMNDSVSHVA
ncbi:MAG TPA: hypothetical protein VFK04_13715 [Gemmatimonadaceae bacterium]|nr:hypothetical protein [Gemmatimonadaceae bacterium]